MTFERTVLGVQEQHSVSQWHLLQEAIPVFPLGAQMSGPNPEKNGVTTLKSRRICSSEPLTLLWGARTTFQT